MTVRIRIVLTTITLLLVAIGFGLLVAHHPATLSSNGLTITATYYPLYEFAQQVGGAKVTVTNITPVGAEPHDYEPTPRQLAQASLRRVFIYNGAAMETWAPKFAAGFKQTTIKASKDIALREGADPHFWLDPVLAQQIVATIRDGLSQADPTNKAYYAANANRYNQHLQELDRDFRLGLAQCQLHSVISSHEAFGYLAERYQFNVEAIAGIDPEQEPSAQRLAELSKLLMQQGTTYVFFESLVSSRLADTLARETGTRTLVFDPIEGLTAQNQQQGKNYVSIQRDNLHNLRTALACN